MHWKDEVGRHAAGGSKPQFIGQLVIWGLCLSRHRRQPGQAGNGRVSPPQCLWGQYSKYSGRRWNTRDSLFLCEIVALDFFDNLLTTAELYHIARSNTNIFPVYYEWLTCRNKHPSSHSKKHLTKVIVCIYPPPPISSWGVSLLGGMFLLQEMWFYWRRLNNTQL